MRPENKTPRPSGARGASKNNNLKFHDAMHGAALIKRLIVAAAIRGLIPASWATWLINSLGLLEV